MEDDKQPLNNDLAVRALAAALNSSENVTNMDRYEITEIIQALQDDPNTKPDDLFNVEWAYLPLLDRHSEASPKYIEGRLANEPAFFCEVIRLIFRSKKDKQKSDATSEKDKDVALNAYRLLNEWQTPPGTLDDGGYDGSALTKWLEAVKKKCSETGHLEVAMIHVGHVLVYAPPDPDGLWICRFAAAALNSKDAGDMRDGFRTELFNSRGVHGFSAGAEEMTLAEQYRTKADAVEAAGFHRLASALKELASSYERDAESESNRDPFGD